jgi:LemA protein
MTAALVVVVALVVVLAIAAAVVYNSLVRHRNAVTNGWALVDTELQRRHDLVPNLVETVRGYAEHERSVLQHVTEARAAAVIAPATPEGRAASETALVEGVRSLFAVAERYPDLKANQQFLELQRQLVDTEDRIAVARRVYNANVRDYNTAIQSFPGVLFARNGRFTAAQPFTVTEALGSEEPPGVEGLTTSA